MRLPPLIVRLVVVLAAGALVASACTDDITATTDTDTESTAAADATSTTADPAESEELEDSAEFEDSVPDESETGEPETADGSDQAAEEPAGDDPVPAGSGCGVDVAAGISNVSFMFEDRERTYQQFVPDNYDADTPTPVVLNWHGLGSTGPQQLLFAEYSAVASAEGFIVISPTGVPGPGDSRNSWEITDADDPSRDDVAFANNVIDRVVATTCVDESRIYTTGMSNGGYFSSRLVCELADRIAAASAIAGLTHPDDCQPSRPVPMLAFHGVDDDVVPFDGGGFSSLAPGVSIPLFELVIPDEFAEFAVGFGCDPTPTEAAVTAEITSFTYNGCEGEVESVFYRIEGAGHTWPGSVLSTAAVTLGETNNDINATQLSWDFFSRHALPEN